MRQSAAHFGILWSRYRLIWVAELAAAAGVVIGLWWHPLGVAAAAGMAPLLVGALITHRRAEDAGRRHASGGRSGQRADWPGEDLAERGSQDGPGVAAGRVPPGDEPVRADRDGAVAGDLPVALPGAARVVVVAVEVADPYRVEREVGFRGELPGRLAPGRAVLAGDQQEPPGATRSLTGRRLPSSSSTQACGRGVPGRVDG